MGAVIAVAAFCCYLGPAPLRELFGLEARNALFARVMLENGPSFIPMVMGRPYPDYPPLFFWTEWLFSLPQGYVSTATAVLPSAISASCLVFMVFLTGSEINTRTALTASFIMALMPDFWIRAGKVSIDMMLALWVSVALWSLYQGSCRKSQREKVLWDVAAFVAIFLAFLTKGPVGIVLPCGIWACFLMWERQWKAFFVFSARAAIFTIFSLSFEAFMWWKAGGMHMLYSMLHAQVTDRVQGASNKPFYYYTAYLASATAPWWLVAASGAFLSWRRRGAGDYVNGLQWKSPVFRLSVVWACFVFLVFNLASARAGRYLLPMFPALAIIFAVFVNILLDEVRSWMISGLIRRIFLAGLSVLLFAATMFCFYNPFGYLPDFRIILIWLLLVSIFVIFLLRRKSDAYAPFFMSGCLLAGGLSMNSVLIEPGLSRMESGRGFAALVEKKVNRNFPTVFFDVNSDGDSVKYALYSSKESSEFIFAETLDELHNFKGPFMLVSRKKRLNVEPVRSYLKDSHACHVGDGLIHSRAYQAWLFGVDCPDTMKGIQ